MNLLIVTTEIEKTKLLVIALLGTKENEVFIVDKTIDPETQTKFKYLLDAGKKDYILITEDKDNLSLALQERMVSFDFTQGDKESFFKLKSELIEVKEMVKSLIDKNKNEYMRLGAG